MSAQCPHIFTRLTGTFYKKFRKETRALLEGIPKIGESVAKIAGKAEGSIKGFFLPGGLFRTSDSII